MFERIHHLLIKEFIQVIRDPRLLLILLVMPVVQMLLYGYAATTDVKHIATAVYDLDSGRSSRELIARFEHSGYFDIAERVGDDRRGRDLIDSGKAGVILHFNRGFEADLQGGRSAGVQVIVDGSDANTAGIELGYASKIVSEFSQGVLLSRLARLRGRTEALERAQIQTRAWFNENLESRNYFMPGVMATVVMMTTMILTCMAVVREKEVGTLEQLMVTPIRPGELILGKTIPFAVIGYVEVMLITMVATGWFSVPIRGSLLLLLFGAGLYLMTTLGLGILVSTISRNQRQAMMSALIMALPMMFLSGFMFPIANMPVVVQWLTYLNPLRYFLVIIRSIFLKGGGISVLWPQFVALAIIGVLTLTVAAKRFRKTLE